MSIELRPSTNEAFAERLRSAEIRKQQELANPCRRPRHADVAAAKKRRLLEAKLEIERIEREYGEIV